MSTIGNHKLNKTNGGEELVSFPKIIWKINFWDEKVNVNPRELFPPHCLREVIVFCGCRQFPKKVVEFGFMTYPFWLTRKELRAQFNWDDSHWCFPRNWWKKVCDNLKKSEARNENQNIRGGQLGKWTRWTNFLM